MLFFIIKKFKMLVALLNESKEHCFMILLGGILIAYFAKYLFSSKAQTAVFTQYLNVIFAVWVFVVAFVITLTRFFFRDRHLKSICTTNSCVFGFNFKGKMIILMVSDFYTSISELIFRLPASAAISAIFTLP